MDLVVSVKVRGSYPAPTNNGLKGKKTKKFIASGECIIMLLENTYGIFHRVLQFPINLFQSVTVYIFFSLYYNYIKYNITDLMCVHIQQ